MGDLIDPARIAASIARMNALRDRINAGPPQTPPAPYAPTSGFHAGYGTSSGPAHEEKPGVYGARPRQVPASHFGGGGFGEVKQGYGEFGSDPIHPSSDPAMSSPAGVVQLHANPTYAMGYGPTPFPSINTQPRRFPQPPPHPALNAEPVTARSVGAHAPSVQDIYGTGRFGERREVGGSFGSPSGGYGGGSAGMIEAKIMRGADVGLGNGISAYNQGQDVPDAPARPPGGRKEGCASGSVASVDIVERNIVPPGGDGQQVEEKVVSPEELIRREQEAREAMVQSWNVGEAKGEAVRIPVKEQAVLVPVSALGNDMYKGIFSYATFNAMQSTVLPYVWGSDHNIVVAAPTSSGKTTIFGLAFLRMMNEHETAVRDRAPSHLYGSDLNDWMQAEPKPLAIYLAPTRAICSERSYDWAERLKSVGKCMQITGDSAGSGDYRINKLLENVTLLVTTPEKFDVMTRNSRAACEIWERLALFMVDEVHSVSESRGATVEVVVARARTKSNGVRLVAVPNIRDIAKWLGSSPPAGEAAMEEDINVGTSAAVDKHPNGFLPATSFLFPETYRPVPLTRHIVGFWGNEWSLGKKYNQALPDVISKHSGNKPVLIFCSTRKECQAAATALCAFYMGPGRRSRDLPRMTQETPVFIDEQLTEWAKAGVAIHHAGIEMNDRRLVEDSFRAGRIPILISTSTLAVGVNLPAHLVIIRGTSMYAGGANGSREYTDIEVQQMMGRAGRPQYDRSGTVVVMCDKRRQGHFDEIVNSKTEVESSLHKALLEHMNSEIGLGTINSERSAHKWLKHTFLWIRIQQKPSQYSDLRNMHKLKNASSWKDWLQGCIECTLENLVKTTLIEKHPREGLSLERLAEIEEDEPYLLVPSAYGRIMSTSCISHSTMNSIMGMDPDASLEKCLEELCGATEFNDLRIRQGEAAFLTQLNDNPEIQFRLSGNIKTAADKVMLLLQARFGNVDLSGYNMKTEHQSVSSAQYFLFQQAPRIAKAILRTMVERHAGWGSLSALKLLHIVNGKAWEDRTAVFTQINRLGPRSVRVLGQNSVHTWADLMAASKDDLHHWLSRKPPFAQELQREANSLPRFTVKVEQMGGVSWDGSERPPRIDVKIAITNLGNAKPSVDERTGKVKGSHLQWNCSVLVLRYEEIETEVLVKKSTHKTPADSAGGKAPTGDDEGSEYVTVNKIQKVNYTFGRYESKRTEKMARKKSRKGNENEDLDAECSAFSLKFTKPGQKFAVFVGADEVSGLMTEAEFQPNVGDFVFPEDADWSSYDQADIVLNDQQLSALGPRGMGRLEKLHLAEMAKMHQKEDEEDDRRAAQRRRRAIANPCQHSCGDPLQCGHACCMEKEQIRLQAWRAELEATRAGGDQKPAPPSVVVKEADVATGGLGKEKAPAQENKSTAPSDPPKSERASARQDTPSAPVAGSSRKRKNRAESRAVVEDDDEEPEMELIDLTQPMSSNKYDVKPRFKSSVKTGAHQVGKGKLGKSEATNDESASKRRKEQDDGSAGVLSKSTPGVVKGDITPKAESKIESNVESRTDPDADDLRSFLDLEGWDDDDITTTSVRVEPAREHTAWDTAIRPRQPAVLPASSFSRPTVGVAAPSRRVAPAIPASSSFPRGTVGVAPREPSRHPAPTFASTHMDVDEQSRYDAGRAFGGRADEGWDEGDLGYEGRKAQDLAVTDPVGVYGEYDAGYELDESIAPGGDYLAEEGFAGEQWSEEETMYSYEREGHAPEFEAEYAAHGEAYVPLDLDGSQDNDQHLVGGDFEAGPSTQAQAVMRRVESQYDMGEYGGHGFDGVDGEWDYVLPPGAQRPLQLEEEGGELDDESYEAYPYPATQYA